MKNRCALFLAFVLTVLLPFVSACKSGGQSPAPSGGGDGLSLEIVASEIDVFTGDAVLYAYEEYEFNARLTDGTNEIADLNGVEWNSGDKGVVRAERADESGRRGKITAVREGRAALSASVVYNGKTYSSKSHGVTVETLHRIRVDKRRLTFLTPTDLSGNPTAGATASKLNAYYYEPREQKEFLLAADAVLWESSDGSVATVKDGLVTAAGNGSAVITATYKGESVGVNAYVYCPIYSAADLDYLSLCTYNLPQAEAEKLLSGNYILMNDIDYDGHIRNVILPIASLTAAETKSLAEALKYGGGGDNSYYSLAWKHILDLTDSQRKNANVLMNADGSEFKGINPNALAFTGILDGNGYSVKNAWLMPDNMLHLTSYDNKAVFIAGSAAFIGYNGGTVQNIEFKNLYIGDYEAKRTAGLGGAYRYEYRDNNHWSQIDPSSLSSLYGENIYLTATDTALPGDPRGLWGGRQGEGSALIAKNTGTLKNILFDYTTTSSISHLIGTGGLVFVNDAGGMVENAVIKLNPVNYSGNDAFRSSQTGYPVAVGNYGSIRNVYVCTDRTVVTGYSSVYSDMGAASGIGTYISLGAFTGDKNAVSAFDKIIWRFAGEPALNRDVHGLS
jgi:hypothetical protein